METDWVALIDSDNEIVPEYFEAIKAYWIKNGRSDKGIYMPSGVVQTYDHTTDINIPLPSLAGVQVDKTNWNEFLKNTNRIHNVDFALGVGNCVYHKSVCKDLPFDLPKDQMVECKVMCKILIEKGYTLHFVPNMKYYHFTHPQSFFAQNKEQMIHFDLSTNWYI